MISVIVPTRSRYGNLKNTIARLCDQTANRSDYEIIISDDNSTDETQSVINEFKNTGRLKYVFNNFKPHSWNASVPRNLGALVADPATQAYYFVDSDVLVPRHAVATVMEDLSVNPNRVIIGPYHWRNKHNSGFQQEDVRMAKFNSVSKDETFETVHDGLACFGGNITIPRDIFWSVKGFDEDVHIGLEDGSMGLKLWKKQTKFSYDIRLLGEHQWHETPQDRFPSDMKQHIDRLNMKHFHTADPDYGIVEASRETYSSWGFDGWNPPESWLENKMDFGLKVNIVP